MDNVRELVAGALGDSFRIEDELTGGGMSRVFVARDLALGRRIVAKVLPPELAATVSADRFRREILLAAALQNPHIVGVLSAGEVGGLPYFTMPYVDGESLATRLRRVGKLSARETVAIVRDVARALAFAHARGVVHRDIKPGNILISSGSATVTDFGVAKALSSSQRFGAEPHTGHSVLTGTGTSLGTLLYMAPEQAAGDPDIDARADIYSLGVTAYEMLTGAPPFAELAPRAMLTARLSGSVPPLEGIDAPPALIALIKACLAVDPAQRPASGAEVCDALDGVRLSSEGPAIAATSSDAAEAQGAHHRCGDGARRRRRTRSAARS